MENTITTQAALRARFWEQHPEITRKGARKQNAYPADTRMAAGTFTKSGTQTGRWGA